MGKSMPLPVRRQMNLSQTAYARLRALNGTCGLANNYLLTVLLERLDSFADAQKLDTAFREFIAEYGAPDPGKTM